MQPVQEAYRTHALHPAPTRGKAHVGGAAAAKTGTQPAANEFTKEDFKTDAAVRKALSSNDLITIGGKQGTQKSLVEAMDAHYADNPHAAHVEKLNKLAGMEKHRGWKWAAGITGTAVIFGMVGALIQGSIDKKKINDLTKALNAAQQQAAQQ